MRPALLVVVSAACGPSPLPGVVDAAGDPRADALAAGDGAPVDCDHLTATVRDFRADHPDFEHATSTDDRGIVRAELGVDGKPTYARPGASPTVSGPTSFDQWYRDTTGVNQAFTIVLPLTEGPPGTYAFDDQDFFPVDGMGWPGTEIYGHNFLFTTEIHTTFTYRGGEIFRFDGDDDMFVFVNRRLAIDLGGVHVAESGSIEFDARAAELGLVPDGTYPLDIFHAERHTDQSHFRMETTIDCFVIE